MGTDGVPIVTDGGHLLLDCRFGLIDAPDDLGARLNAIPGVVEHGLFLGIAKAVISAGPDGVTMIGEPSLGEPSLGEPSLGEPSLGEPSLGDPEDS
jgi:hypothetical protein